MEPLGRFAKMYLLFDRSEREEMLKHYIEAKVWSRQVNCRLSLADKMRVKFKEDLSNAEDAKGNK